MSLRRARQRRRLTITSLIDVIFLLLLFFMLASTFSKFSEIEVTSVSGESQGGQIDNALSLIIDPHHVILDGEIITLRELEAAVTAHTQGSPKTLTVEIATEAVTTQRLTDILTALNQVPNASIHIVEPDT